MKKLFGLVCTLIILSMVLSACAPAATPAPAGEAEQPAAQPTSAPAEGQSAGKTQIKWLTLDWTMDEFEKKFEEDNPTYDLVIEKLPFNDLFSQIQIRMGAKSDTFDVLSVDVPVTTSYGVRNWLLPLDDLYTAEERADWLDSAVTAGSYQGKLISAPVNTSTQLLFYNADLLEAAGVTPPGKDDRLTYEQVAEMAQKVVKDENGDGTPEIWGFSWEQTNRIYQLGQMPASLGGKMIGDDGFTVDGVINSPEWIDAFTFYQKTFTEWKLGPQDDTVSILDLFKAGKIAMIVGGPWNIRGIQEANVEFKWGVSRTPYMEGGEPATPTGSWHVGINPNSKNIEAARVFVHYISTNPGAEYWWRLGSGDFPAQKSVLKKFQDDAQFNEEPMSYMRTAADEATVNPVGRASSAGFLEYEQILQTTFQDIRQGADVKASLDSAAERIGSEMKKYQK